MTKQIVKQLTFHRFRGKAPEGYSSWQEFAESIPLYDIVDREELYKNDASPFHLTLEIAEVNGRGSDGFRYDEDVVDAIQAGLPGLGGSRGHEIFSEPYDEVDWVGHKRVGNALYAKGYIRPGEGREDIRLRMARGGEIRTSVMVQGEVEEFPDEGEYKVHNLEMISLDLLRPQMAAYTADTPVVRTTQSAKPIKPKGNTMPQEPITISDVPESVQRQIIEQSTIAARAERVEQLESELEAAQGVIAAQQVNLTLLNAVQQTWANADVATIQRVNAVYQAVTTLFGENPAEAVATIQAMHQRVVQLEADAFNLAVSQSIEAVTAWNVTTETGKQKLTALRAMLQNAVQSRLTGTNHASEVVQQAVQNVYAENQVIAESVRDTLAGPHAVIPGRNNQYGQSDTRTKIGTDERRQELRDKGWQVNGSK